MLKERYYNKEFIAKLKEKLGYANIMQIPKLTKVCINMGIGEAIADSKAIDAAVNDLSLIAGQKAIITYAKKSIAAFKIRKNMPIGCKVTLRKDKMYEFLERLLYITLPREKAFTGLRKKQFDGRGNCSLGVKEHISFIEIDYDKCKYNFGLDINIVTTARNNNDAVCLLKELGFPFI